MQQGQKCQFTAYRKKTLTNLRLIHVFFRFDIGRGVLSKSEQKQLISDLEGLLQEMVESKQITMHNLTRDKDAGPCRVFTLMVIADKQA